MFKKILFATTASPACDHAARVAFEMADRYQAALQVLHVMGIPSRGFGQMVTDVRTGEELTPDEDYIAWVMEEMKNTYAVQLAAYPQGQLETISGIPHTEILRHARKMDADLIVMGGHTRDRENEGYAYHNMAGSTLQSVAKHARCPVLVVSRTAASFWGGVSSIVFGTDFSRASEHAFRFALETARKLDCKLHLFHALDISALHAGKALPQDEVEDQLRDALNKIRKKYVSQMKGFTNFEMDVWEGIPYVEIVKYAREKYADLIVMAHHTQSRDVDRTALGSTMEQVILRANAPVISVNHPDKLPQKA
jgi:nucleotide-binding universal stress UspA family protein